MTSKPRYTHQELEKRVSTSARAKRSHNVAIAGLAVMFVSFGLALFALIIEWTPLLLMGAALGVASAVALIAGSLVAARAVNVGVMRGFRFAMSSAARGLCNILKIWASA